MKIFNARFLKTVLILIIALISRFYITRFIGDENTIFIRVLAALTILIIGTVYIIRKTAKIIEETTDVLSHKTKLAGGLLQSIGTAFPDMILGVSASLISLRLISQDYSAAINYAIIAAATTFGSNIYNMGYGAWCIYRQNQASKLNKKILLWPKLNFLGTVTPLSQQINKPHQSEIVTAIDIINILNILTATVAISMVIFGSVNNPPQGYSGQLYQLIRPVGIVIFVLSISIMYYFRKSKRPDHRQDIKTDHNFFQYQNMITIFIYLLIAAMAILFIAESMIISVETLAQITGIPFVVVGVLTGLIGCLGEIAVIHNFTTHPDGRIGDAIVGVSMDNVVTTMGASIVAMLGGIFLGSNALILIFVIILTVNTILMHQITKLKSAL